MISALFHPSTARLSRGESLPIGQGQHRSRGPRWGVGVGAGSPGAQRLSPPQEPPGRAPVKVQASAGGAQLQNFDFTGLKPNQVSRGAKQGPGAHEAAAARQRVERRSRRLHPVMGRPNEEEVYDDE